MGTEDAVIRNFRTTAADEKSYDVRYYNLDVIISVGYPGSNPTRALSFALMVAMVCLAGS